MTEVVKVHARLAPQPKVEPVRVAIATMSPAKAKRGADAIASVQSTMARSLLMAHASRLPSTVAYLIHQKGPPSDPTPYDRIIALAIRLGRMEERQEITQKTAKAVRKHLKAADAKRLKGELPEAMEALDSAESLLDAAEAAL